MMRNILNILQIFSQNLVDPNSIDIPKPAASSSQIEVVMKFVFGLAAVVAIIFVILGGINYITSTGDPQKTAKAKNTILYALIGLAVAVLANFIVAFALGKLI